jgi:peptidyl-prolyl cis-trans isomerase SurA
MKNYNMSNKIFICVALMFLSSIIIGQDKDEVLMKVGNSDVRVSEFKYIYEKNNGANADYSEKNVNEYLDLYIKFKLKVEKAKQLQLDTISALISELSGYRKQLASSYLIDKEVTEFLLRELYDRMKYDVEFSHIFIPVAEGATKSIREEAKSKLREIKSKIVGGMSFENAASEFSSDRTTALKGGNMGYFTAKLPSGFYELESALYKLKPGQISDIVESRIGFHLIKVTNTRPARGIMEVAHILLKQEQQNLADSIYNELLKGKDFDVLALNYSIDKTTAKNGGKLPPFGINTYDKTFEETAFSLGKDGAVSKPVLTKSGWHIIKRLAKPSPDSYELFVRKMKAQINKDQRFDAAKLSLISDIKKAAGYKDDRNELQRFVASLNEDFYSYKWSPDSALQSKMVFSLGGSNIYTIRNFADYCKKNTKTRLKYDKTKPISETIDELFTEYVNESAMEYEEKTLEMKYGDFKSLMREYEEGILLFEATKINVWDKANQDTVGLKLYYDKNKSEYIWPEKAAIVEYKISGVDKKTAEKIYKYAVKNDVSKVEKKFNKKTKIVQVTNKEFESGAKELSGLEWKKGSVSSLLIEPSGTDFSFKKLSEIIPSKQKNLSEARGYVVADYQDYLEKEWIGQLTKEFNVEVNKEILSKLKKQ